MNLDKDFFLSASILSADFSALGNQIHEAEAAGVNWIHIDVMDGHFVPNITMGPFIVETCRRITNLPLDVHLMIDNPEKYIEAFAKAGANRISVHIEGNPNSHRTLQAIHALGVHPGIVLNPGTPASSISSVLPIVDHVLVMTVNPGYSGQLFIHDTLPKIKEIHRLLQQKESQALIQVDGGITKDTIKLVFDAGARIIVAATSVFKHNGGINAGVQDLRNAVK
jgi:ribulose-phosphate 3-epimerase